MTLDALEPQREASILSVSGDGALAQRLLAMGFQPGAAVRVVQIAPLGDPLTVDLEGWRVSLRRSEARRLEVEPR